MDLSVACTGTFPGLQVATCRSCGGDAGILPHTCSLLYSFSEAEEFAVKAVANTQEKVEAMCLMLVLGIQYYYIFRNILYKMSQH